MVKNFLSISKKEIFTISLILILTISRVIPHEPNFTPIISVAIMSGYFFRNIYLSYMTLFIAMLLADLFIGFYENMFFIYATLFLITYIFYSLKSKINLKNLYIFSLMGSSLFYLISNFGVWFLGEMYEKNLDGLVYCYFLAIPFFKNTIISTLIFTYGAFIANYFFNKKFI